MNKIEFEPIIGLEIHVELKTNSKMFCGCSASYFGHEPNTHCCPVCLGLPGALPVPNKKAIEWCVMLGLALNCEIPEFSKFDRKNYFYPDLPKGYQISQYDRPFCINGWLDIKLNNPINTNNPITQSANKKIRIRRVHMEEDTGKLMHATIDGEKCTLIDFNRSAVPLVEIVTEPDIRSSEEARIFLKKLYQIVRYLGISDADMEKGSMRLEPNISVRYQRHSGSPPAGGASRITEGSWTSQDDNLPRYKVEVKNINSFNFVKKAIDYEIIRHIELLKKGKIPIQETRGWDEKKGITYSQRSKEEAHDYRYFPEPDIPPIRWDKEQITKIKEQITELPDMKIARFMKDYGLSEYDATILTDTRGMSDYYEKAVELGIKNKESGINKTIANWIINKKADITKVAPEELIKLIATQAQKPTISDEELEKVIKKVISGNPKAVIDYKSGKQQVIMFLVGQVMREVKGQAEAEKIKKLLQNLIN